MKQDNPQQADWIYAAGFFDGEGGIAACEAKTKTGPCLHYHAAVAQSSLPILLWFWGMFGGRIQELKPTPMQTRTQYQWVINNSKAAAFLLGILPYSKVKKEHIEFVLELWDNRKDKIKRAWYIAERKRRFGRAAATTNSRSAHNE